MTGAPRSLVRPLYAALVLAGLSGGIAAQDDAELSARVMAALGGKDRKDLPGGRLGLVDDKAPSCPVCGKALREVPLWEERGGMDSGRGRVTALVCLADQLFTVRMRQSGMGINFDGGPIALPAAGALPPRPGLPWGSMPLPDEATKLRPELCDNAQRSVDGGTVIASDNDSGLQVWKGGKTLFEDRSPMGCTAWALSDDGKYLAFARSQGPVRVIALATGKESGRFRLGPVNVMSIAFEPGGERLLFLPMSGGGDKGTLELGTVAGGKSKTLARVELDLPTAYAWMPKQGLVAMATFNGDIRALAMDGSGERWSTSFGQPVDNLAAAPDGSRLCAAGNGGLDAAVLDGAKGEVQRRVNIARMFEVRQERGCSIAWSGDSRSYAWVLSDGRIARGEVSAPKELQLSPGSAETKGVRLSFTGDGKDVVTATLAGTRLQWQIARFPAVQ